MHALKRWPVWSIFLLFVTLGISACGGNDQGGGFLGNGYILTDPNGTPISGATVFFPSSDDLSRSLGFSGANRSNSATSGGFAGASFLGLQDGGINCDDPIVGYNDAACTGEDGGFSIFCPAGTTQNLSIQINGVVVSIVELNCNETTVEVQAPDFFVEARGYIPVGNLLLTFSTVDNTQGETVTLFATPTPAPLAGIDENPLVTLDMDISPNGLGYAVVLTDFFSDVLLDLAQGTIDMGLALGPEIPTLELGRIYILDTEDNSVLDFIPITSFLPISISANPNGLTALVTGVDFYSLIEQIISGGSSIALDAGALGVIDTVTNVLVGTSYLPAITMDAGFNSDGTKAVVTGFDVFADDSCKVAGICDVTIIGQAFVIETQFNSTLQTFSFDGDDLPPLAPGEVVVQNNLAYLANNKLALILGEIALPGEVGVDSCFPFVPVIDMDTNDLVEDLGVSFSGIGESKDDACPFTITRSVTNDNVFVGTLPFDFKGDSPMIVTIGGTTISDTLEVDFFPFDMVSVANVDGVYVLSPEPGKGFDFPIFIYDPETNTVGEDFIEMNYGDVEVPFPAFTMSIQGGRD